jgi:hypothetical protein
MEIKLKDQTISTECTWGDGPDVCLHVKRSQKQIDLWGADFVPLDLTSDEAIRFGKALLNAGHQAKELERSARVHDEENIDENG